MQQPPSQDPINQSGHLSQPLRAQQPDQMVSSGSNTFPPTYGQEEHPGEEAHYSMVPQPPSGSYPTPYYPDKLTQPKPRRSSTIIILILLILVLILGTTTILALRRTGTSPVVTLPTATTQPGAGPATPVPTTAPSPIGSAVTSTPSATAQPTATVASGTITENLLLGCGGCNDPIRVTITTIQIDDANGRMIWNVSMKDITGSNISYGVNTFELEANASQTQIPATFSQPSGNLTANESYSIQGTFAFVPAPNTPYTLNAVFIENGGNVAGGVTINFDPVQINL